MNDKQLLLKDLCARLPYGVICKMEDKLIINDSPFYDYTLSERHIDLFRNHKDFYIKPYLRPMSSMTEEEKQRYNQFIYHLEAYSLPNYGGYFVFVDEMHELQDWLNRNHFDYRGLIEEGLAIEAPENMYKQ